jgi:hypothetical protein
MITDFNDIPSDDLFQWLHILVTESLIHGFSINTPGHERFGTWEQGPTTILVTVVEDWGTAELSVTHSSMDTALRKVFQLLNALI